MKPGQAPHLKPSLPSLLARCQAPQQGGGSPLKATVWECVCALWAVGVGGGEPSLVAPTVVRRALTWCLPSLKSGPYAVLTVTQLQNKHVSSTHPETTGNLHHVSEYPLGPLIDFYCVSTTASRSLHSPDSSLWEKSQDRELNVLSLRGEKILWVLNNN